MSKQATTGLETDVCIVGSGPAGLVIADRLGAAGRDVVVLESGATGFDAGQQSLNDGVRIGDPYAELSSVRRRQVGGTVASWNTAIAGEAAAKYTPLDPIDFTGRVDAGLPAWPIDYPTLRPWYEEAQRLCGLGPYCYRAGDWQGYDATPLDSSETLTARVYQFGYASVFTHDLPTAIRSKPTVQMIERATATAIDFDKISDCATSVKYIAAENGAERRVLANTIVLAAGTIENARLLLLSGYQSADGDLVGRCFMEHPRDYTMLLRPDSVEFYSSMRFFDQHSEADGTTVLGRIGLNADCLARHGLPQVSVTLLPQLKATPRPLRLARETLRLVGLRRLGDYPVGGAGWSERPEHFGHFQFVRLLLNLEQAPSMDNRIALDASLDALGQQRTALSWRWSRTDAARLERIRTLIAEGIEAAGFGTVEADAAVRPDPNAHHHAGTTRMSTNPADGVVDADCRLHDIENVFVAGASVFPSAGFANPTLTIVALALRLAARLQESSATN